MSIKSITKALVKKHIPKDSFRMIIYGATQTGKTYFLRHHLLEQVADKFDKIYVFTVNHNKDTYTKILHEKLKYIEGETYDVFTDPNPDFILQMISVLGALRDKMYKTDKYTDEGDPIYGGEWLYVFDDILNKTLTSDPEFRALFVAGRHQGISVVMITQVTNDVITTAIKGNTDMVVIFPIYNTFQRREILARITEALIKRHDDRHEEVNSNSLVHEARSILSEILGDTNKYRFIMIDQQNDIVVSPVQIKNDNEMP